MSNKKPRRKEMVTGDERRKAEFLSEYASLCEKHGMLIGFTTEEGDDYYHPYVVMEVSDPDLNPSVVQRCVQEMLMGDLWMVDIGSTE